MKTLNIYNIDLKYIRDLHNVDSNVMSQSPQIQKDTRRYIGIIMMINGKKYCVPLSSGNKDKYQIKNKNIDLLKIPDFEHKNQNGAYKTLAVLNINNMIPVNEAVISKMDLHIHQSDSINVKQHKSLLQKELNWCRKNYELIQRRVNKIYAIVVDTPDKNKNLTRRCCDFKKLEAVLEKRNQKAIDSEKPFSISRTKIRANADKVKSDERSSDRRDKHHNRGNDIG